MDHPTQFKRALARLGVHLEPACSPEARGRSERAFGTLQERLVKEMAQAGIIDMESANDWLKAVYPPRHNRWLARKPRIEGKDAFVPLVDPGLLEGVLCESHDRIVGSDNYVSFESKALQMPAQGDRPTYRRMRVQVKRSATGGLSIRHGPRKLAEYDSDGPLRQAPTKTRRRATA